LDLEIGAFTFARPAAVTNTVPLDPARDRLTLYDHR
jgi:hypothetical protein